MITKTLLNVRSRTSKQGVIQGNPTKTLKNNISVFYMRLIGDSTCKPVNGSQKSKLLIFFLSDYIHTDADTKLKIDRDISDRIGNVNGRKSK